ncbi:response regulator transcription factor [Ligilactobacillus murinus]|uniref:response regulator transcription factor n=1 Tax=Ligilactobacillus murinus TaxID=1622 RepID=UPI00296A97BF|nr:response regulator transcription factor [Ligilactobacillus murinus]WOY89070.1 response regulator transcription factor [Ligilactobacillus murinus]
MRILLVENELNVDQSLAKLLKEQNYSVDTVFDGQTAFEHLSVFEYDLLILDVILPLMDGFTLIEKLRQKGNIVPVLILTAKDSLADRVKGLDIGADDYLVRPFEFEELLARIRALLRRKKRDVLSDTVQFRDVTINIAKKQVKRAEQMIELTAKEYEVLEYLVRNRGQILTREQIREHVWGLDYEGESNIIDVIVKNIRQKLADATLIKTKRGLGYVIEEA